MRHIKSSRVNKQTAEHTHVCPLSSTRISSDQCLWCHHLSHSKANDVSYEIFCDLPATTDFMDIEPAKAWDPADLPAYLGNEPTKINSHELYEPKRDGARVLLYFAADRVYATGRHRNSSGEYSEFADNIPHIRNVRNDGRLTGMMLDGEIMVIPNGMSATGNVPTGTLGATMSVVGSRPEVAIATQKNVGNAHIYVFDILRLPGGKQVIDEPLYRRREYLQNIFKTLDLGEYIHPVEGAILKTPAEREKFFKDCLAAGHEGAVAKDLQASYGQLYSWIKVKERVSFDAVVTGFEFGSKGGKYERSVGTLLVSVIDSATGELREIAKVVPGNDEKRLELTNQLTDTSTGQPLSAEDILSQNILVEIEAQSWTKDYRLRHPRILRYRTDKDTVTTVNFDAIIRH